MMPIMTTNKRHNNSKRNKVQSMEQKKNNWVHLAGCDWSRLLQFQPRFADKCDWSKLGGDDWASLLRRQPQFAEKCDWPKLEGHHWVALLRIRPEFADYCAWNKLEGSDWINLIAARPEFIDRCDWSKFTAQDIVLVVRQSGKLGMPMAALYLDKCDFSQLSASDWSEVLAVRPDLVGKFESVVRDWDKDVDLEDMDAILDAVRREP